MKFFRNTRLLFSAIFITGAILVVTALLIGFDLDDEGHIRPTGNQVLAQGIDNSTDECVVCHVDHTPGIVNQFGESDHFSSNVSCSSCHLVDEGYAGSVQHPDSEFYVLPLSSTAQCAECHREQVDQFNLSRHALPAYVAYAGTDPLTEEQLDMYQSIPERGGIDARARNSLHAMEGEAVTRFACETCHDIGQPNPDGSIGNCTDCHIRHEFSLEQARRPETCNACHIGPDHPQWEIYFESGHGISYATGGDDWNWDAEPGTLTTIDFPAPTCATCHMSGFGLSATTHDVGDRLTWFLAAPISARRPAFEENRVRMQQVCLACHSNNFVDEFYDAGDALVDSINTWIQLSDWMMQPLKDNELLTPQPFDQPIDYTYFNIWHHWGRTAKFGSWMQGADYVQWHGAYEIMHDLTVLREEIDDILEENGFEALELPEDFPSIRAAREVLGIETAE